MPSWQARLFSTFSRWMVKRNLHRLGMDEAEAVRRIRRALEPSDFFRPRLPREVKVEEVDLFAAKGEWVTWTDAPERTVYYLHGGGYVACTPATHRGFTAHLSRAANAKVFALDYRRAPEHRFPAALEDAVRGYRMLLEEGERPEHMVIGGDSAGGGLTLATLIALRDRGLPLPSAAFCLSPWTDLAATGGSIITNEDKDPMLTGHGIKEFAAIYHGQTPADDPLVSPLYGDLIGLPPLLIYVSNTEILLDDSVRLAARAKKHGVKADLRVWNELPHVWPIFVSFKLPEAQQALGEIAEFVRQQTSLQQAKRSAA
ncbi:MAG TPA: alpha/beta hydrolase [Blastocatellia bacterium]|nr:alpha/beta hydrolase [Blastocatellia bacterium]HMV82654.1 alpha/beta hydrolase [Blastocatellia bacterium]HMY74780.1 alpha/beta hydrolase [Blastocatellia bacterium]HMZ20483.1 alpha/beta hydrolase [Blastocatellia bacterium]HNG32299.1 alpha/beta hydrolase [Blastocatellia bacterium]